jgi:transposase
MTQESTIVLGGVDTHKDVHVAAVVNARGKLLDAKEFSTTAGGYAKLLAWMQSFGTVDKVGVEGTGAYGAGLARHLADEGIAVVEVNRPNRQMRRRRGKSDTVDAEAAARAALNDEATVVPKSKDSMVESIRVLRVAYTSARNSRTRSTLQIRDLVLTGSTQLRAVLGPLTSEARAVACSRLRPGDVTDPAEATKYALRSLARRHQSLTTEMADLAASLDELTALANPALRAAKGVGPDVAAILLVAAGDNPERLSSEAGFAALCGASPVEASSGKVSRHRLNRSGNRQANHALWVVAMTRLNSDPATKAYMVRRTAEGKTRREIVRCLKRYIAREMFQLLTNPELVPVGMKLRVTRNNAKVTLQTAATALGTTGVTISRLERGLQHNCELARRYEEWLENAS